MYIQYIDMSNMQLYLLIAFEGQHSQSKALQVLLLLYKLLDILQVCKHIQSMHVHRRIRPCIEAK